MNFLFLELHTLDIKEELKERNYIERVYHIAKLGFVDQHFQRIDGLEIIEKKMWLEYNREHPFKRIQILKDFIKNGMYIPK